MKNFLGTNWYKLMIGPSLFMASLGFLVRSITPAKADSSILNYRLIPTNADGSINVKLSDEQLKKIIPKNEDGSINVKISSNSVVDVNIEEVGGYSTFSKLPVVIKENQDK